MIRQRTTVKHLIAQLKKMPQDAVIVWQDHDQYEYEFNALVNFVTEGSDRLCDEVGAPHGKVVALQG